MTMAGTMSECRFCLLAQQRITDEDELSVTMRDRHPVSLGHTLVIPRRHFASFFEATAEEQAALWRALHRAKTNLDAKHSPDGYNIGVNDGAAAGQTVMHLHIHLIPRYLDDKDDPRGGVRWIFPQKAKYWTEA